MNALITQTYEVEIVEKPLLNEVTRFLMETHRDKSPSTYKTYSNKLKIFIAWYKRFGGTNPHREELKAFRMALMQEDYSPATINLILSVVRSFYRSLLEQGKIETDPTLVLKNVSDTEELKKTGITKKQFYAILAELENGTGYNADRDRVLFLLLTMNGLRISEAAEACTEDIKIHQGRQCLFLKRKGYTDKSNYVVLQDKMYQLLMDFMGDRTGHIFVSYRTKQAMTGDALSRVVKTIFRRNDMDSSNLTAHSLRHAYAIFAIEGGANLTALSKSMNHKNISTTQRYLSSYDRVNNAAEDAIELSF